MCTVDICCLHSNRLLHRTSISFPYSLYCSPLSIFSFPLVLFIILHSSVQLSSLGRSFHIISSLLLVSPLSFTVTCIHPLCPYSFSLLQPVPVHLLLSTYLLLPCVPVCSPLSELIHCLLFETSLPIDYLDFTFFLSSPSHPRFFFPCREHMFFNWFRTYESSGEQQKVKRWAGWRQDKRFSFLFDLIFPLREKMSLVLSHQGRDCVDISSFWSFQESGPLTFAQDGSALCFLLCFYLFISCMCSVSSLFFYSDCTLCGHVAGEKVHGAISVHACFRFPIWDAPWCSAICLSTVTKFIANMLQGHEKTNQSCFPHEWTKA